LRGKNKEVTAGTVEKVSVAEIVVGVGCWNRE
jgi:hypothetical protein